MVAQAGAVTGHGQRFMTDRRGGVGSTGGVRGDLKQRVKTARKRTVSQTRWLERQLNDPYVARAKREGYRSRAAFKLIEIDERFKLLKPGQRIVDLGAAPGGWSQVAARVVGPTGKVVGIDLLPIEPMAGVEFITLDFLDDDAPEAADRSPRRPGRFRDVRHGRQHHRP